MFDMSKALGNMPPQRGLSCVFHTNSSKDKCDLGNKLSFAGRRAVPTTLVLTVAPPPRPGWGNACLLAARRLPVIRGWRGDYFWRACVGMTWLYRQRFRNLPCRGLIICCVQIHAGFLMPCVESCGLKFLKRFYNSGAQTNNPKEAHGSCYFTWLETPSKMASPF